ncbi:hypothetical protein F5Y16DRAFT_65850 [Xylariaceae sp. FL0255]|nr:hypothetical protein F5Y16DRAFT_65850 [Xylariaceae sp. FL0255]
MAATSQFFPFKRLPAEIRDMIWDAGLLATSATRVVLVHDVSGDTHQGGPQANKYLVSPFLLVNRESRHRAMHFCSDVINVYEQDPMGEHIISAGKLYLSRIHDIFFEPCGFDVPHCGRRHAVNGRFLTTTPWRVDEANESFGFSEQTVPCYRGAEKICFVYEYPRNHQRGLVSAFDAADYDYEASDLYKLPWIPERDRRLALFIPKGIGRILWSLIYEKGWAGLQRHLQMFDDDSSFVRCYGTNEQGGLDHSRPYNIIPGKFELITPAQFLAKINSRGPATRTGSVGPDYWADLEDELQRRDEALFNEQDMNNGNDSNESDDDDEHMDNSDNMDDD